MKRHIFLAIAWLGLLVLGLHRLDITWNSITKFSSKLDAPVSPGNSGEALTERLLIVLIDGLREDTAQQLPYLQELVRHGASYVAITDVPSYSKPGMAAIVTGAYHEVHGIATNSQTSPIRVDNIFTLAREKKIITAMVQAGGGYKPYTSFLDEACYTQNSPDKDQDDDMVVAQAKRIIADKQQGPLLLWVHLSLVDKMGHKKGGGSPEYREAALRSDKRLAQVVAAWQQASANGTVLVTSDHGHRDEGGHGGIETIVRRVPVVWTGKGIISDSLRLQAAPKGWKFICELFNIIPGQLHLEAASQRSLASTVSFLLGTRFPGHAEEPFVREMLAASPQLLTTRSLDFLQQQQVWTKAWAERLQTPPPTFAILDSPATLDAIHSKIGRLAAWRLESRHNYWSRERTERLFITIIVLLHCLVPLLWPPIFNKDGAIVSVVSAVVFSGIAWGWQWVIRDQISLSLIEQESMISGFFVTQLLYGIAFVALTWGTMKIVGKKYQPASSRIFLGMAIACFLAYICFYYRYGNAKLFLPPIGIILNFCLFLFYLLPIAVAGCVCQLWELRKISKISCKKSLS